MAGLAFDVVGISGIDTRALTRHLRERGAMRCGLSSVDTDAAALLERVLASPQMAGAGVPARKLAVDPAKSSTEVLSVLSGTRWPG